MRRSQEPGESIGIVEDWNNEIMKSQTLSAKSQGLGVIQVVRCQVAGVSEEGKIS